MLFGILRVYRNASQVAVALTRGVQQLELSESLAADNAAGMEVQQSSVSDFTARCLCSHPQVPLKDDKHTFSPHASWQCKPYPTQHLIKIGSALSLGCTLRSCRFTSQEATLSCSAGSLASQFKGKG